MQLVPQTAEDIVFSLRDLPCSLTSNIKCELPDDFTASRKATTHKPFSSLLTDTSSSVKKLPFLPETVNRNAIHSSGFMVYRQL